MAERTDNEQHLRLLATFHYIVAGFIALFAFFPLIHVAIGWFLVHAPPPKHGEPPPAFIGWFFMVLGGALFLLGESFAVCVAVAGRFISTRCGYWFVFVIACLQCGFFPFGTILGVFTIVVLSKPTVKEIFGLRVSEQPGQPSNQALQRTGPDV